MALNNFFKINFPYGIMKNVYGQWAAFNREYKPLGHNDALIDIPEVDFIFTDYGKLSDEFLMSLADGPDSIKMDKDNNIVKVFFYNDSNNPSNFKETDFWDKYFEKMKFLGLKKTEN